MRRERATASLNRREILKLGASAVAAGAVGNAAMLGDPRPAGAQTPKRGGICRFPGFDPPYVDPYQTPHWWTFINLSLTHSRLLKVKAGPAVPPGTQPIEPDPGRIVDEAR